MPVARTKTVGLQSASRLAITSVKFTGYRALRDFTVRLASMNLLVGPNNCGKSTIISSFRVLAQALRRARSRPAESLLGPYGRRPGWTLPEDALPIAYENIHSDYGDIDSTIEFFLSNGAHLLLYFPVDGGCRFFADYDGVLVRGPGDIKRHAPLEVYPVPVLGPLEHDEPLVQEETVRKNLSTTRAARNFRNYWLQYPDGFDEFSALVKQTWSGMEIQRPERMGTSVAMFCLENRLSRELYWAGFGFQIWLQLLTHISRASRANLIVIDEPEIYLHPDVQRQLLGILRDRESDVLLATHSTEMISEADPHEILLVDKAEKSARRLKDIEGVQVALESIGSAQNILLTRLARNRRLVFVEGSTDFQLLRRFARRFNLTALANGTDLTPIESGGFTSWEEVRALASGFERALGVSLKVAAIYDRDFWCDQEIDAIKSELAAHLTLAHIHRRKEVENYLLVPEVLDRAIDKALAERYRRTGKQSHRDESATCILDRVTRPLRDEIQGQYIAKAVKFLGGRSRDAATVTTTAIQWFDSKWSTIPTRMEIVPGKVVLALLRTAVSEQFSVSLTDHRIVSEFTSDEAPRDLMDLLAKLDEFTRTAAP